MKSPSQPSIETQVQNLEQRSKIAEQLAFSKNAEAQAAQRKFDSLTEQIAKQTERLLAEQVKDLAKVGNIIEQQIAEQREVWDDLETNVAQLQLTKTELTADIDVAKSELAGVKASVVASEVANDIQRQVANDIVIGMTTLKTQQSTIELAISKKVTESDQLRSDIQVLQDAFKDWQQRVDSVEGDYADKIASKEESIKQLDAKLLERTTDIEQNGQNLANERELLANRMKQLDDRDRNLRIREQKVEIGENKLVQNSNLLNL